MAKHPEPAAGRPDTAPARQGSTLLVVDDDDLNREMLGRRLKHQGFHVLTAPGGAEALDLVRSRGCDLVLLDVMMPAVSGLDVLAALRASPATARLPVIMVTARGDSQDIVDALERGANDYVTKPIDLAVTLARVRTQLDRVAAERAALARQRHSDLQHAQKISTVGHLAGGVANGVNRLLSSIQDHGTSLRADLGADDVHQDDVSRILEAADTATGLTRELLALSRREPGTPQLVDLGARLDWLGHLLGRVIDERIVLDFSGSPDLWRVLAPAAHLDQVLLNLILNACEAMPEGGRLTVRLDNLGADPTPTAWPRSPGSSSP
ncbi:MAG: response regulator [Vicinamibacterales bacterium]